jgi:hypothetical protein
MVSVSNKPSQAAVLLLLAVLAPFAFTTLYLAIMQGRGFYSRGVHETLLVFFTCCCIPFVYWLPFALLVRVILALVLVSVLYIGVQYYGHWAACALFHSCM